MMHQINHKARIHRTTAAIRIRKCPRIPVNATRSSRKRLPPPGTCHVSIRKSC